MEGRVTSIDGTLQVDDGSHPPVKRFDLPVPDEVDRELDRFSRSQIERHRLQKPETISLEQCSTSSGQFGARDDQLASGHGHPLGIVEGGLVEVLHEISLPCQQGEKSKAPMTFQTSRQLQVFLIAAVLTRPNVCSAALEEPPAMCKCLTAHLMGAARRWIQRNRANLHLNVCGFHS